MDPAESEANKDGSPQLKDDLKQKASSQALVYLIIISLFLLATTVISLFIDLHRVGHQYEELATAVGRSIFQELVVVRRWNAQHGGVYVPVTKEFQPNPYLEDVSRDVTTTDGTKLTKITPEYMTRLLSDLLKQDKGVKFHITSLKLTDPANQADPWEEGALKKFEKGSVEEFRVERSGEPPEFRYMAPLKAEATCLRCHAKQGYRLGDIRGGISVSFPYEPFLEIARKSKGQIYSDHLLFFIVGLIIVFLLGKKLIVRISDLQKALLHIKRLEGFLPICSGCKKIRLKGGDAKEQASWIPVEWYIQDHTDAQFSHGLCPECMKKLYGFEYEK